MDKTPEIKKFRLKLESEHEASPLLEANSEIVVMKSIDSVRFLSILAFLASVKAEAESFGSVLDNFEEKPSEFIFNIIFIIILLVLGGVFAGTFKSLEAVFKLYLK